MKYVKAVLTSRLFVGKCQGCVDLAVEQDPAALFIVKCTPKHLPGPEPQVRIKL
jgi:hypothetical protein